MILAFLGKGGSGKSSVSSQMALYLASQQQDVLAIDADHNMDLSYNLVGDDVVGLSYYGNALMDLQLAAGLDKGEKYSAAFLQNIGKRFTLSPLSSEIEKYSMKLENGIRLMSAGPQTNDVLYGKACSHILTTPLKLLLPLLELQENEVVVIDEKAGADGVSTGIITGVDVGVIVCEPALHSIKTAKQIAELMKFYGTPYIFVGNKVTSSEDKNFIEESLGETPITYLMESIGLKRNPYILVSEWTDELSMIWEHAQKISQNNRLERTIKKFKRNHEFSHN
jgi:CO dehydrogenase maturation factor